MSPEEPKVKRDEKRLYEPIRERLGDIFANFYIQDENPLHLQRAPLEHVEKNPYLEVVGDTRRLSGRLQRELDKDTLSIIIKEGIFPDIVGYVMKKPKNPQKEIITVEIKDEPIKMQHIAKAKFYQDIYNATFGLLISSKEISQYSVNLVLENKICKGIRGRVIIAQSTLKPLGQYGHFLNLEINPDFKDSIPEPFKRLCKP